jgi:hypothetical protein
MTLYNKSGIDEELSAALLVDGNSSASMEVRVMYFAHSFK